MSSFIEFALRQRFLAVVMLAALFMASAVGDVTRDIDAHSDRMPPEVDVITKSGNRSAEEAERDITLPIEIDMAGMARVSAVHTLSMSGLSEVKVQFNDKVTQEQAQQWVAYRLSQLSLPVGVLPQMASANPSREVMRYRLQGPSGYSVADLKTLDDWVVEQHFKAISGVVDATRWGGKARTYDLEFDLKRLASHDLTLPQVLQFVNRNSTNVGGQAVEIGSQSAWVRGIGFAQSAMDIRRMVLAPQGNEVVNSSPAGHPRTARPPGGTSQGTLVLLGDVALVHARQPLRFGMTARQLDNEAVEGVVLMHPGEQGSPALKRVQAEMAHLNSGNILPPGVQLQQLDEHGHFVKTDAPAPLHSVVLGVALFFLLPWTFLGHLRSALLVIGSMPLFAMDGIEGHIVGSLLANCICTIVGVLIAALVVVRALMFLWALRSWRPPRFARVRTNAFVHAVRGVCVPAAPLSLRP